MINVDEMLRSGKKDELFKAIAEREKELKKEAVQKAKAEAEAKVNAEKRKALIDNATKAVKAYLDFIFDEEIPEKEVRRYVLDAKDAAEIKRMFAKLNW